MIKQYNIKVECNGHWMEYSNNYFIENLDDYKLYLEIVNSKFTVSENEIKNNKTWIGHGHSLLTGISGTFCGMIEEKEERTPMLFHLKMLHAIVLRDQLNFLIDGNKLVINQNGGYFPISSNQKYRVNEISNIYYTENDIKTNKWWGGKHYYAKVGNIDVVDDDGNVKWNTKKRAREVALKYMYKLNNNN